MEICSLCKRNRAAKILRVCRECLLEGLGEDLIERAHRYSRSLYNLPSKLDRGKECNLCPRRCKIEEGKFGYCGLVENKNGKLIFHSNHQKGLLEYYFDPLPTNCVAAPVCPLCKLASGYNLAVFYCSCNLDCLFCQNYQWKERLVNKQFWITTSHLQLEANKASCICFFGGDPSVQAIHSISVGERIKDKVCICWETNGIVNRKILKIWIDIAIESGGIIKFDFKAYNEEIYKALTGFTNKPLLRNLKIFKAAEYERDYPLLVCSTLLVPEYVTPDEVKLIAEYLAEIDENIPLVLLAYCPHYLMRDIGFTKKEIALQSYKLAKEYLKEVYLGNVWLLR